MLPDMSSLMTGRSTLIFIVVAVPFIIVALVFFGWTLRNRRRADASGSWNKTTARIVQSQVEARRSHDEHGYHTVYYPVVIYEYAINGQRYQNDRINFGPEVGFGTTGPSDAIVGRYHVGNVVDIYFDPSNPAESVLERSAGSSNNILLFVGVIIVAVLLCTGVTMFGVMAMTGQFVNGITTQVNGILTQVPK
jgi:hypothetical protein